MIALITNTRKRYDDICNSIQLEKYPNGNYMLKDGTQIIFVNSIAKSRFLTVNKIIQNVDCGKLSTMQYAELSLAFEKLQSKMNDDKNLIVCSESKEQLYKIENF